MKGFVFERTLCMPELDLKIRIERLTVGKETEKKKKGRAGGRTFIIA